PILLSAFFDSLMQLVVDSMAKLVQWVDIIYLPLFETHPLNLSSNPYHGLLCSANIDLADFYLIDGHSQYPLKKKKKYFERFLVSSPQGPVPIIDRKSTRLNSSHVSISY